MSYVDVLRGLISIDTSVPPGNNYSAAMSYLEPLFKRAGFETQQVEIPPLHAENKTGRVNLICHRRYSGKPRLIFYAHVDVVPAEGWNAFEPRQENGKMYGRGAADMKGGIVGLLHGLEAVKDKAPDYDVSVAVTTDEEVSQASQLKYIARFLEPVKDARVFSLDSSFGFVSIANLGLLQMDIAVKGKSVHSGLAHLGENAVENAVPLMQALLNLKQQLIKKKSVIEADPATGLNHMEPRLNLNMINGGIKVNIIPEKCLISIDRRLIPEENLADAEAELLACLSAVSGVRWEVERVFRIPTVPPCEDAMVDKLAKVIGDVTGKTGKYGEMGSGDLPNIVTGEWHGKCFGLGAIRPECNIHGRNEFVYLKDIEALGEIIARFLVTKK